MSKKEKWFDKVINNKSPDKLTKKEIKKYALKKMGGSTKKERFKNYFTNSRGYYSWKEMILNYLIVIFLVGMLITGIFAIVNWRSFSLTNLLLNPIFTVLVICVFIVLFCLWEKRKCKKHRFNCFLNNGNSDKYVFWKDDISNPKNKPTSREFK